MYICGHHRRPKIRKSGGDYTQRLKVSESQPDSFENQVSWGKNQTGFEFQGGKKKEGCTDGYEYKIAAIIAPCLRCCCCCCCCFCCRCRCHFASIVFNIHHDQCFHHCLLSSLSTSTLVFLQVSTIIAEECEWRKRSESDQLVITEHMIFERVFLRYIHLRV